MLKKLAKEIHENAVKHGWWEEERNFGEIIALCHSELSEALEEYRNGKENIYFECQDKEGACPYPDEMCYDKANHYKKCKHQKPEGIAVEMADCIIRILDWCGKENIDIDKIIKIKHEYNKSRPYKHWKQR